MRKQYTFLILIAIMLHLLYLIIGHKYKEFKINLNIQKLTQENKINEKKIVEKKELLNYLSTNAYIDYMLKESRGLKDKGEQVIIFTKKEPKFKKFKINNNTINTNSNSLYFENNYDKWFYFLIGKQKEI